MQQMRLSIGILAYNEEASIQCTIGSLFDQSLLKSLPAACEGVEIVVVANGCTDETAGAARQAFADAAVTGADARIQGRVEVLAEAGKTNAWNEFVHRLSDQSADFVVVMDGDVRVHHPETLSNLITTLNDQSNAVASRPRAIKHIEFKQRKSIRDRLSLRMSELNRARPYGIAGCMYCVRGEVIRRIWFPKGLLGDDAVLNGLILTDNCRHKEQFERVARADNATVVFETYRTLDKVYKCQRRMAVIRGMDAFLWDYLWTNVGEYDAGELIRRNNERDPEWFRKWLEERLAERGWWVMPKGVITRRLRYLRYVPWGRRIALVPWTMVAWLLDVVVHVEANWRLRTGRVAGLWFSTKTTQI